MPLMSTELVPINIGKVPIFLDICRFDDTACELVASFIVLVFGGWRKVDSSRNSPMDFVGANK